MLLLPDVSPGSVVGIFRELGSWVVARSQLNVLWLNHCTQLVWCHHVRGGRFLIRCCAGDGLWLVCALFPLSKWLFEFCIFKFSSVGNHVLLTFKLSSFLLKLGHRPHNNESGSDHHARDDITSVVYNDVGKQKTFSRLRATTQEPSPQKMPATDAGETSGRRSISRPRFLSPKSKHSSISADLESLNQHNFSVSSSLWCWSTLQAFILHLHLVCSTGN